MARTVRLLFILGVVAVTFPSVATLHGNGRQTVGLFLNAPGSYEGYTIFSPTDGNSYLIDNDGRLVHSWITPNRTLTPYLQEDGSIIGVGERSQAGILQLDWDGSLIWEFPYLGPDYLAHHDLEVLPNGNVLLIVREVMTGADAIEAGRDPDSVRGAFWPDKIIEVERTGPTSGNIVWEWRVWDHLIQDFDPTKENSGIVEDHPELVDINVHVDFVNPRDWLHPNGIDYNPELDQIVFSVRHFNEFWIIDHSTTTEEAASHSGGNSGKGGDLLYRWGNPQAYRAGDASDQQLFIQHDAQWIEPGMPGAGNILLFNNGLGRPEGNFSSVEELVPPVVDAQGNYPLTLGQPYGPLEPIWTYSDPPGFYSDLLSGVGRLPNGNTLITSGAQGTFFEVTRDGETVWNYLNPVTRDGPLTQGDPLPRGDDLYVFRAYRYPLDYSGLQGRDLTPQNVIELEKPRTMTPWPTTPTSTPTNLPASTPTPVPLLGDIDGDGMVTAADAELLLQHESGILESLPDAGRGDVNGDGIANAKDAAIILQLAAGLLPALPI